MFLKGKSERSQAAHFDDMQEVRPAHSTEEAE